MNGTGPTKSQMKRMLAKWPFLLLLIVMPVLVFAQSQQDDKDKKNPPPPPKKAEKAPPPKQAPPPRDNPPPRQNPPQRDNPPPRDTPPPRQTPPQQAPPPRDNPPPRQTPPAQNPPPRQADPTRGRQPDAPPTQGGQQPRGGQPPVQSNAQPARQPVQPNGAPNLERKPLDAPPQPGERGTDSRNGRPPLQSTNQPTGQSGQNVQQPRGGQPTGQPNGVQPGQRDQQPHGGQPSERQPAPGNNDRRNRVRDDRPAPAPIQVQVHTGNATVIRSAATISGGNGPRVTTIRTDRGVTINRTDYGRRVDTVRPGGVRVVSIGVSRGFVERPISRPGFVQRTYVVRGRPYVRVYHTYRYRGFEYHRYVPAFYFGPRFYFWAYNPWARPVYWSWGWGRAPWFYDGYFAPAPYYVSASLWLTDFIIAENLRAAYEAQQEAEADAAYQYAPPPDAGNYQADPNDYNNAEISPALRQAIADEVQRQLDADRAAANNPQAAGYGNQVGNNQYGNDQNDNNQAPPPALAPDYRVFVVSNPLQVYDGDQPCSLTPGDIISRIDDTPGNDGAVGVSVLTSKNADCRPGAQPRILVDDLQDMQNDLQAQTDEGLKRLSESQGTNGMPAAPDVRQIPNPNGQGTADPDVVNQLRQQQQDADQTEREIQSGRGPGGDGAEVRPNPIAPTPIPYAYFANLAPFIDVPPDPQQRPILEMTFNPQPFASEIKQPLNFRRQAPNSLRFTVNRTF